jgi:hypothetical protein
MEGLLLTAVTFGVILPHVLRGQVQIDSIPRESPERVGETPHLTTYCGPRI